jgi:hypothetical protein
MDDQIYILCPYPPALDSLGVMTGCSQASDDKNVVANLGGQLEGKT